MKTIIATLLATLMATTSMAQTEADAATAFDGSWRGTLRVGAATELTLVLNVGRDTLGHRLCTLDSPDQGAFGIAAEVVHLGQDTIAITVPQIAAAYQARLQADTLRGTFRQMGVPFQLSMARGTVQINRPQTPQPPYPYTTEELTFSNAAAAATLSATLTMPASAAEGRPCPVVLMVTGSGPQDRDEQLFGHKPFLVIADRLARHGIATLRYDDRGTGQSTGVMDNATTADLAQDAAAGLEWLRRQGRRFTRVGVLGHSEGATIAFMLAARGQADYIVALAAPAVKGDTILAAQMNGQLQRAGAPTRYTASDMRRQAEAGGSAWLRYFVDYDPATDIAQARCPVMAVCGTKDKQVEPELNFTVIESTLPKGKHNLLKLYDGLNHLLQHCSTGYPDEYARTEETMSEQVMSDIADWINGLR